MHNYTLSIYADVTCGEKDTRLSPTYPTASNGEQEGGAGNKATKCENFLLPCIAGSFWGSKLLWILRFCNYLQKFSPWNWGEGGAWYLLVLTTASNLRKFSLPKSYCCPFVNFFFPWKFPPAHRNCYLLFQWTMKIYWLTFYKVYMFSNCSTLVLVLPWRIWRRVLYLSRPSFTFSWWRRSICVCLDVSRDWASSLVRDYGREKGEKITLYLVEVRRRR